MSQEANGLADDIQHHISRYLMALLLLQVWNG